MKIRGSVVLVTGANRGIGKALVDVFALPLPKTSPEVVARAIVDAAERGEEGILPDPMSREVYTKWTTDPKSVERMFAAM